MTQNRRIALNILATYMRRRSLASKGRCCRHDEVAHKGPRRSLYALALGLFTARWALEALGTVDYGLYGVVGGLTVFITYLNGILGGILGARAYFIFPECRFVPRVNAGFAVGSQVSAQTNTLSGSLIGAFSPAIPNRLVA